MNTKGKFVTGWKMTPGQKRAYFQMLQAAYTARGLTTAADKEFLRKDIHIAAFGPIGPDHRAISAKDINHTDGFDKFKAACLAISHPADLNAQMEAANQWQKRLLHAIHELADPAYILALLTSPRFKKSALIDLERMSENELTQFRNTLAARMGGDRRQKRETAAIENPY